MNNIGINRLMFGKRFVCASLALFLLAVVGTACNFPGFEERPAEESVDPDAQLYRMYFDSKFSDELQVRKFSGQLRLADYEKIFGKVDELPKDKRGNYYGGPVLADGLIWTMVANPTLSGVSVVSVDTDSTVSSAIDLNGDGIADIVDILLGDGRRISIVTEGLGLEIFEGLLLGNNPLCDPEIVLELGLEGYGCDRDSDEESGGGSQFSGGGLGIFDPFEALCSKYDTSEFRAGVSAVNRSDGMWLFYTREEDRRGNVSYTSTAVHSEDDGSYLGTDKLILFLDDRGRTIRMVEESVDSEGVGERLITDFFYDGTVTHQKEQFRARLDANGDYRPGATDPPLLAPDIDPNRDPDGEDLAEPPPEPPPAPPEEGNPGPEGDDSNIASFCERRANFRSGVEQAAEEDPASFSVSCGDLVGAPDSEDCIIVEWAGRGDFAGAIHPSEDDGCGEFEDPDTQGNCEPTTAMERLRGLTAMFASLNLPDIVICPPVVCNPGEVVAVDGRQEISITSEAPGPLVTETPTPEADSRGEIIVDTLCYGGPGADYGTVSALISGTQVEIIGVGAEGGWLVIDSPRFSGVDCWVDETDVEIPAGLDLSRLPEVDAPTLAAGDEGNSGDNDAPAAASGLKAVQLYCDTTNGYIVRLTWKDNADNESGYRIFHKGTLIGIVGANTTHFTTGDLGTGATQDFYVIAYNNAGSAQSNMAYEDGCIY